MSRIIIDESRCKGCGLCTSVCPYELVRISDRFSEKGYRPAEFVDDDRQCIACAHCAMMCPDVAITVYRLSIQRTSKQSREAILSALEPESTRKVHEP